MSATTFPAPPPPNAAGPRPATDAPLPGPIHPPAERPAARPGQGLAPVRPSSSEQPHPERLARGGQILFEVPFRSAIGDFELARLAGTLDLVTHMYKKLPVDPNGPGVARLDHFSGLYLERGERAGEWVLRARSWRAPSQRRVHEWHMLAAVAAQELDPSVGLPEPLPPAVPEPEDRQVGEVANRRLARLRRHLAGLP